MPSPKLTALYNDALEMQTGERERFVREKAGDDLHLRKEVLDLLAANDRAGEFLGPGSIEKFALSLVREPEAVPVRKLNPGDALGDFTVRRSLGSGGFGDVYLAYQNSLGREVAIKVTADRGVEARTLAPLDHPNIVKVLSNHHFTDEKMRALCMPFVVGSNLEKILSGFRKAPAARGLDGEAALRLIGVTSNGRAFLEPESLSVRNEVTRLDAQEYLIWLGIQVARALEYAHRKGVLHLDIKPANILLTEYGQPMLADFNVAVDQQSIDAAAVSGGTRRYMSPEQERAFENGAEARQALHAASDIYSLGVLLSEIAEASGAEARWGRAAQMFSAILDRCRKPAPQDRPRSASEVIDGLQRCLELRALERQFPEARDRLARYPYFFLGAAGFLSTIPSRLLTDRLLNPVSGGLLVWLVALVVFRAYGRQYARTNGEKSKGMARPWLRYGVLGLPILFLAGMAICELWQLQQYLLWGRLRDDFVPDLLHTQGEATFAYGVALSLSFWWVQRICLGTLYPLVWDGAKGIRRSALSDLALGAGLTRALFVALMGLPLVFAVQAFLRGGHPVIPGLPPFIYLLFSSIAGLSALASEVRYLRLIRQFQTLNEH